MAWFGESFANIKGQISNFTKEVLTDTVEDSQQEEFAGSSELQNFQRRARELEELAGQQGNEIEFLRTQGQEREEVFDRQIKSVKESYQKLLDNNEEEKKRLREHLEVLEITFQQLESKKNASEEKLLELQLEGASVDEKEKKQTYVCSCDISTNTDSEKSEYDELVVRELDERCSSYQNELFVIRNELMTLQHHTDELEERNAKLNDDALHAFNSDFLVDGQPALPIAKLKRRGSAEENAMILSALKQLASLWKDLVEKKGLLERTVTKLSQKQIPSSTDSSHVYCLQTPIPINTNSSTVQMNPDTFIPSKIDSFGLETILEEDRNDEESRSESGFISPGVDETVIGVSSHSQRTPSPSPAALTTTLTTSSSSQTELRDENEGGRESLDLAVEAEFKAEIESLQLQVSKLVLREQALLTTIGEKEIEISRLQLELNRLGTHLVETEDQFTMETLASEEKVKQLEGELSQLKKEYSQALQDNEPSEDVRNDISRIMGERNEAWVQTSALQDQAHKLTTQLQNLHFVLEQFQKEKEIEIVGIERRFRGDMNQLEQENDALKKELEKQENLLEKAKSGLDAAQQLNAQIEEKARAISCLKAQVQERDGELSKLKSQMEEVAKNLDGKIDRYLVKNLVVGYFSTPSDKRKEVLRVLATVLDFNREDRQKTSLESTSIWPFWKTDSSTTVAQDKQSLSEAFIHFLESESEPKVELRIPAEEMTRRNSRSSEFFTMNPGPSFTPPLSRTSLANSPPPSPPLIFLEMSMSIPPVNAVDRSNSILKDVLNPKP